MLRTKLAFAVLAACAAAPAFAQNAAPLTIQEWTNRQAEIKRAEMESKLNEVRNKGTASSSGTASSAPATPVPAAVTTARTCDDDLSMSAVYGIGKNLRAEFTYRGAVMTAAPGDHADMGGWMVEELTPTRATMIKNRATGKGRGKHAELKRCPLYLTGGVRDFAAPPAPAAVAAQVDTSVQVPPISPVPSPAAVKLGSAK